MFTYSCDYNNGAVYWSCCFHVAGHFLSLHVNISIILMCVGHMTVESPSCHSIFGIIIYPKSYTHCSYFILFCCGWHWSSLPISLGLLQSLQRRHNERDGISNHQPHHCLHNGLFRPRSKKTSKLSVTGLCAGNSPVTGEFPGDRWISRTNGQWREKCFRLMPSSWTQGQGVYGLLECSKNWSCDKNKTKHSWGIRQNNISWGEVQPDLQINQCLCQWALWNHSMPSMFWWFPLHAGQQFSYMLWDCLDLWRWVGLRFGNNLFLTIYTLHSIHWDLVMHIYIIGQGPHWLRLWLAFSLLVTTPVKFEWKYYFFPFQKQIWIFFFEEAHSRILNSIRPYCSHMNGKHDFQSLTHSGLVTPYGDKRSGSTLAQVMACCLTTSSHYLNQCWLIISEVRWHSY